MVPDLSPPWSTREGSVPMTYAWRRWPGLDRVDRVPARQGLGGICPNSTHPLCALSLMPTDQGQLDEGIGLSGNPDLPLSVDLLELHPA